MTEGSEPAVVMLVDDTPENLTLLQRMLEGRGYRIVAFPRGELALRAAAKSPPDLVLLDISMPELDGFEVCRRMKADEVLRRIPVIFISALSDTDQKVRGFEAGGVDYVTKPFQIEEVTARVAAHLGLRALQRRVELQNAQLNEALARQVELERARDTLVQMIVHDLKNPLASTIGNSRYALGILDEESKAGGAIRDVFESAQAMQRMVMNILDVFRPEGTQLKPRFEPVAVDSVVESAVRTLRPQFASSNRSICVNLSQGLPPHVMDRDLIERLVENLLDNANKYTRSGGTVNVAARVNQDSTLILEVADNGPGVPPEERTRIFEIYSRLDRDHALGARHSRGLGLAFCKMAAEAHGGRIWVEDNAPTGARFCVALPIEPRGGAAPADHARR